MDKEDKKSLDYYIKQKKKAERNGNLKSQTEACSVLGDIYSRYERYDEAIEEHQQELILSEAQNCILSIALANRKLGECYCKKQLFDKAIPLHKRYLSLARESGNKVEEQRALATIGATYMGQCECETTYKGKRETYKLAEQSFIKGLEVTEEIQSTLKEVDYMDMKGRLYQNLGLLYDEMNHWDTSSQYFQKALAINKKYNLLENMFLCQSSLIGVYQKHGNITEAKKHAELCLETTRRMKARENEACALMLKAMILVQEKEFHLSRHLLKKAHKVGIPAQKEKYEKCFKYVKILHQGTEKLADSLEGNSNQKIKLYDKMGDAAADLGLYKQAIHYYEKLLQASIDEHKEKKMIAMVHVSLAETLRDDRQLEKAIQHYKHEIDCRSELEQDQVCRSWMNIGAVQELYSESHTQPQDSYVNAFNAAKIAKNRKLQVQALENLIALCKYHKKPKQLEKSQDKLKQILSKYHLTDSELEEDSQELEQVDGDDDDDNVSEMSELTESEDEEIPSNTVSATTVRTGRTTRKKVIKKNLKGETPLHTACIDGKLQEVQKHLSQGHPVNVRDNGGWTPLHEATNFGYTDIVRLLIEHGANVNDRGGTECSGLTPLMDAASNGMVECVQMLIDAGANVHAKDDNMMTALDHLTDYVERTEDEMTNEEKLQARNMMEILKDKMPFHRVQPKVPLVQKSALIPESEAKSFTKKIENKKRSRNDIIYDDYSDSDQEDSQGHKRKSIQSSLYDTESQEPEDELYDPGIDDLNLEDNATAAYRKAMTSIGSSAQRSSQVVKKSPKISSKKTALIAENEYFQDDWLIDDMKPAAKRRKMNVDGYALTSGITPNHETDSISPNHGTAQLRKGSASKRTVIQSDSDGDSDMETLVSRGNQDSPVGWEIDSGEIVSSPERCSPVSSSIDDFPVLQDLFGGSNNEDTVQEPQSIERTKISVKSNSFKKKSNRQSKLTDFGASVSQSALTSKPDKENNYSISLTTQPQWSQPDVTTDSNARNQSMSKAMRIKVQIEDKLLLVPVVDSDRTKTFSWLVEEAATRYSKMFGLKPHLRLGTKDGAHFAPDDLITLILTDGEKIEGFLKGWDLPSMTQQYKASCKSLKTVVYKNIENLMRLCEDGTGKLNLKNLSLRSVRFQPVLSAIQHQNCLRELELKGNRLGDHAVESLSQMFYTIPNLTILGLACNNITKEGLRHIAQAVTGEHEETSLKFLTSLDLSYNPLYDECQQPLLSVIKSVSSLNKLYIASCNLTAGFFKSDRPLIAQVLNDSSLQHIDISYNQLENVGVYFFLRCQNPTKILSLNLSSTVSKSSSRQCEHLCDYVKQDGCILQKLELRNLHFNKDTYEEMKSLTESASHLQSLDLSSNSSLDNQVMSNLIQGSCHATSQLEQLVLNNCGVTSPLGQELLDVIGEKLTMPRPLRDLQFTCHNVTMLDFDSVEHVWRNKWSADTDVFKSDSAIKLGVVS